MRPYKKTCYTCRHISVGDCDYYYGMFSPDSCSYQDYDEITNHLAKCPYWQVGVIERIAAFFDFERWWPKMEERKLPKSDNVKKEK